MWFTDGHRGGAAGRAGYRGGDEGLFCAEQCPAPVALRHPGPQVNRCQVFLPGLLYRLSKSHQ